MPTKHSVAEPPVEHIPLVVRPLTYERVPDAARTDVDLDIDEADQFWIVEDEHGGEVVATVSRTMSDDAEAMAQLFAAAPEMLELLKTTAGNVRSLGPAGALGPYEAYRPWLEHLERVIAKAEGR